MNYNDRDRYKTQYERRSEDEIEDVAALYLFVLLALAVMLLVLLMSSGVAHGAAAPPGGEKVPPVTVADINRFPSKEVAEERLAFLGQYLVAMGHKRDMQREPSLDLFEAQLIVENWERAWSVLVDCHYVWYSSYTQEPNDNYRIAKLEQLMSQIGLRRYCAGRMPWFDDQD